jgi:uncharacterized protein involved in exopolysaccharide biosynthesis
MSRLNSAGKHLLKAIVITAKERDRLGDVLDDPENNVQYRKLQRIVVALNEVYIKYQNTFEVIK